MISFYYRVVENSKMLFDFHSVYTKYEICQFRSVVQNFQDPKITIFSPEVSFQKKKLNSGVII